MKRLVEFLKAMPLLLLALLALPIAAIALAIADLIPAAKIGRTSTLPDKRAATLVIPNWNGVDLLKKFAPSWLEAIRNHPGSEVLVVDNGSEDGSADWLRANHPEVRVIALPNNLGFGGGSNAGIQAAANEIVVLLNSDMRVDPHFLQPLLDGFVDEDVFAVSCQIFLSDPAKPREETGLTQGWWQDGALRVSHKEDAAVDRLFPCFYGGGGSCAFDQAKFLELGGFDELLAPFYVEDTDLGFMAWKRGWKVFYQPASVVFHEHRGTIGKKFSREYINTILEKNFLLFAWKNIHEWPRLMGHFAMSAFVATATAVAGRSRIRAGSGSIVRAFRQLPAAVRSRRRAIALARVSDTEAFRRSQPAWFHDSFSTFESAPEKLRVLFVSPYPICPPTHGGGVFMYNTLRELSRWCEVHAVVMIDYEREREAQEELRAWCRSLEVVVRTNLADPQPASIVPHAVREFYTPAMDWLVQRLVLLHGIDVVQLDYTSLGQYARSYRNLVCALFEHDVYFQSIARSLRFMPSAIDRSKARIEYLRAIRYELKLLTRCDHIQVCTAENKAYLESFKPELAPRIESGLRAGVASREYGYPGGPREPFTMLFIGSFRHLPNRVALEWFGQMVLPAIVAEIPEARLLVAGSDPPPAHSFPQGAIELLGFVEDLSPLFARCAVFVCPVRSGSGVRVKLLEAFASGIPVVSTTLGAEGLARNDGEFAALSDEPREFAQKTIALLRDPEAAQELAARARLEVEANWDSATNTAQLAHRYRDLISRKRDN